MEKQDTFRILLKIIVMELKLRLEILSKWLQKVTTDDFYYDVHRDGKLESAIAQAQVEVCNKIGGYLEEIIEMDSNQINNELK